MRREHRSAMRTMISGTLACATIAAFAIVPSASALPPSDNARILARIKDTGRPCSGAADRQGKYAFISVCDDSRIDVIDVAKGVVAFTIALGGAPNDLVVAPDGKRLYVPEYGTGKQDYVEIVDVAKRRAVARINTCKAPLAAALSPNAKYLYVTCTTENSVSVIDLATRKTIKEIPTGQSPVDVSVSPDGTRLFVSNSDGSTVSVLDAAKALPKSTMPTCIGPIASVVSKDGAVLYVACYGAGVVWVIDIATHQALAKVAVRGMPIRLALSPDDTRLYIAARGLHVMDTATNTLIGTIKVQDKKLWNLALSPNGREAYVSAYPNYTYILNVAGFTGQ